MIIVCPQCESRYELTEAILPDEGRMVRCTRCRAEWMAFPEPDDPAGLDDHAFVPRPLPAASDDGADGAFEDGETLVAARAEVEDADAADAPLSALDGPPSSSVEHLAARDDAPLRRGPKARRGRTRLARLALSRPVLIAASLSVVAFILAKREPLVRTFPSAASFYRMIGLPVNLRGLTLEGVTTEMTHEGDTPVLVVKGTIRAVAGGETVVPRLRLAIRDKSGVEIYSWTAVMARTQLASGETMAFKSRLAAPPAEGQAVMVRFLRRDDMLAQPK